MRAVSPAPDPVVRRHAVRLVVADDLRRRRLTVLFRLVLAIPHLVWLSLFAAAALMLGFVAWLAVLFERRVPGTIHRFLASYVRYTVHLTAYLTLAAGPYPGFTGGAGYPVDVEIDPPTSQGRLGAGFRLVLAVPAVVLSSSLAGSGAYGAVWGLGALTGSMAVVAAFLGWFAALVLGRMPRGLRDAVVYSIGYGAQTTAYTLLVTDRYPDATPGSVEPAPELPTHPIAVVVRDDLVRPRLIVAFRALLSLPHLLWLALWGVLATLAALAAWVLALVLGRVPRFLHRFLAAFVRANAHLYAFLYVVGRPFPGFVGREGSYPIDVTIAPPERQRRLGVLVRLVLAIPAFLVLWAYASVLLLVALLGWFAALVTGRMPRGLRDLGVAALRYHAQASGYVFLLTSRYPDSSPVLVGRPARSVEMEPVPEPAT
jgi:hypothetical protein